MPFRLALYFSLHSDVISPPCRGMKSISPRCDSGSFSPPSRQRSGTKDAFPAMSLLPKRSVGFHFQESGRQWPGHHVCGSVPSGDLQGAAGGQDGGNGWSQVIHRCNSQSGLPTVTRFRPGSGNG